METFSQVQEEPTGPTWNSTASTCSEAEQGITVALGCRRPASAVRQYQKNKECQGSRLVLKYGSPISTEICAGKTLRSLDAPASLNTTEPRVPLAF